VAAIRGIKLRQTQTEPGKSKVRWTSILTSSGRAVARMSQQGGTKITRGHIFKYIVGCMQQPPWKKSLAICKLYSRLTRPRKLYRYERRTGWAPSFDVATWAK